MNYNKVSSLANSLPWKEHFPNFCPFDSLGTVLLLYFFEIIAPHYRTEIPWNFLSPQNATILSILWFHKLRIWLTFQSRVLFTRSNGLWRFGFMSDGNTWTFFEAIVLHIHLILLLQCGHLHHLFIDPNLAFPSLFLESLGDELKTFFNDIYRSWWIMAPLE